MPANDPTRRATSRRRVEACVFVLCGLGGTLAPARVVGQTVTGLSQACVTAGGWPAACSASALAAQAVTGQVGLAGGLGSEVSGTASNLGQRLGASPRLTFAVRAGLVRGEIPDLREDDGLGTRSYSVRTVHVDAAAGLFDGFRVMPTVGGFLALDVFGRAGLVLLPGDAGFDGGTTVWTLGARVGLLRESFTLPGVSVSVARRFSGAVTLGSTSTTEAMVVVDPSVTSVRATVGKDLFAVEILAGVGWEDYSSDVAFVVPRSEGGGADPTLDTTGGGALDASRRLYFLGASRTFSIVLSLAIEAGVAQGFAPLAGWAGTFDPGEGSFFGGISARLII